MTKNVITVNSTQIIKDVTKKMYENRVGSAVVLYKTKPIGMVTDRNIAVSVAVFGTSLDSSVDKIMSSPLIHVSPEESILKAAEIMTQKNIRKLPVVDHEKLVGIITVTDLAFLFTMLNQDELLKTFGPYLPD